MDTITTPPAAVAPPPLPPAIDTAAPAPVSGFWRRLAAFVVDGLIIGVVGFGAGLVAFDTLSRMGGWERLIGLAVVLAYAGVLNSRLGGGRTLGKRLLGIRVIGLDGRLLSLPRTLLRQAVFATPFFLNGAPFPESVLMGPAGAVLSVAVFGGLFAIAYLAVFNRASRRSLHDLAAGSYVVRTTGDVAVPAPPTWRGHLVVVAAVAVVAALAPFAAQRLMHTPFFEGVMPVYRAMTSEPGVLAANAMVGQTFGSAGNGDYVAITLTIDSAFVDDEKRARRLARKVIEVYPEARGKDAISITFVHGYNMVISSSWRSRSFRYAPEDLE